VNPCTTKQDTPVARAAQRRTGIFSDRQVSIGNLIQLEQEYINPDKPQTDSVEALALIGPPAGANPILSIKPTAKQPALAGPRAKTARPQ
jgi:hypothetical protein